MFFNELEKFDSEVFAACDREFTRQQHNIELIASENIVSKAVLMAAGTVLTNKYAEGYPGKRYYGGCVYVDETSLYHAFDPGRFLSIPISRRHLSTKA